MIKPLISVATGDSDVARGVELSEEERASLCPSEQDIPQEVEDAVMNHVRGGGGEGVRVLGSKGISLGLVAGDDAKRGGPGGNVQRPNGCGLSPSKLSEGLKHHNMREI